jgi:hypothetical protein
LPAPEVITIRANVENGPRKLIFLDFMNASHFYENVVFNNIVRPGRLINPNSISIIT